MVRVFPMPDHYLFRREPERRVPKNSSGFFDDYQALKDTNRGRRNRRRDSCRRRKVYLRSNRLNLFGKNCDLKNGAGGED